MNKAGVYVHIPFCHHKCPYCDFYSEVNSKRMEDYTAAVINSINTHPFGKIEADTLYFGGGTPTVLGGERLARITRAARDKFGLTNAEITLEANPESSSPELLAELKAAGFNRISFGVQSSHENELKALGRIHTADEARRAILASEKAGFENISADLMIGTPYQTQESLLKSVDFLLDLPLSHISAYMLSVEEGTPYENSPLIKHTMGEDEITDSYLALVEKLDKAGFIQYEISNFAKNGKKSLHNLKYWDSVPYLGIGSSAHSYFEGRRFSFNADLEDFIATGGSWEHLTQMGKGGDYAEYGMLKLRLSPGLDTEEYKALYPEIDKEKILKSAGLLEREGMLKIENGVITFTPEGFLLSNYFIAQLLF